jgi:hypothetical protein
LELRDRNPLISKDHFRSACQSYFLEIYSCSMRRPAACKRCTRQILLTIRPLLRQQQSEDWLFADAAPETMGQFQYQDRPQIDWEVCTHWFAAYKAGRLGWQFSFRVAPGAICAQLI